MMPATVHVDESSYSISQLLNPGYYIIMVKPAPGETWSLWFGRDDISFDAKFEIACGGSILIRLRLPITVKLTAMGATGVDGRWGVRNIPSLAAALVKLLKKNRMKSIIPLQVRAGYICFLEGINDFSTQCRLREEAIIQRSLAPFGLDDLSIPSLNLFDEPLSCLPAHPAHSFPSSQPKIGIFLHLYYLDLWPEFAAFLKQIPLPFDLWITHCGLGFPVRQQILELFPRAAIREVENRGRDIWPFISLLNKHVVGNYDYICKIHSKKSAHQADIKESLLGSRWRRRALYDLLAGDRAWQIAEMFVSNPKLGIVGPSALRIPNAYYTAEMAWGCVKNREFTCQIVRLMGGEVGATKIDFFAGSMFWAIPAAFEPLRRLKLQREDFPEEKGQLDGELQHAIERAFTLSALLAGLSVANVGPLEVRGLNEVRLRQSSRVSTDVQLDGVHCGAVGTAGLGA